MPVVRLLCEVDVVEPVTRVIGITVHRLRANHIATHLQEWDALTHQRNRCRHILNPHSIGAHHIGRQAVLQLIPERLIIVLGYVVDDVRRITSVARRLAVPGHCARLGRGVIGILQHIVSESARHANAQKVHFTGRAITQEELGTTHRFADTIVEGAKLGTRKVELRSLDEESVINHLAEVPALTVEVGIVVNRANRFADVFDQ